MDIVDLKERIIEQTLDDSLIIFQYTDNDFIVNQYIHEIANYKALDTQSISSLKDTKVDAFSDLNEALHIYRIDKLEENTDFESLTNTIIVCKTIDKDLVEKTKEFVVKVPALLEWQIEAYMQHICPGLDPEILNWLYTMTKGDIYKIDNEVRKIGLFDKEEQASIFNDLNSDNNYNDLTTQTIFNYLTAVMKKDKSTIYKILKDGEAVDLEGTGLVTLLIRQLKNIIKIQLDKTATAESLGLKYNQFKALKYSCGIYTDEQLIDLFEFVTSIDYKLKSGDMTLSNIGLVDYVTCKFLSI